LQAFAAQAVAAKLADPRQLACALGEVLSEVKTNVVFDASAWAQADAGMRLDRRTRMLYDRWHVFVNGESFRASGRDAKLMRRLADLRELSAQDLSSLSLPARGLVDGWARAGWLHPHHTV
jgi:50S ribosomal protein L16 3-hydroxylase